MVQLLLICICTVSVETAHIYRYSGYHRFNKHAETIFFAFAIGLISITFYVVFVKKADTIRSLTFSLL